MAVSSRSQVPPCLRHAASPLSCVLRTQIAKFDRAAEHIDRVQHTPGPEFVSRKIVCDRIVGREHASKALREVDALGFASVFRCAAERDLQTSDRGEVNYFGFEWRSEPRCLPDRDTLVRPSPCACDNLAMHRFSPTGWIASFVDGSAHIDGLRDREIAKCDSVEEHWVASHFLEATR